MLRIASADRLDDCGDKLIHLFRRSANELSRFKFTGDIHSRERWIGSEPLVQRSTRHTGLAIRRNVVAVYADTLVQHLAITAL